jgi:hypothetical protein
MKGGKMNRDEMFRRNHELFEIFMQQSIDQSDLTESISDKAELIFLPDYDQALREANLQLAEQVKREGKQVVFVRVDLTPETRTVFVPHMKLEAAV